MPIMSVIISSKSWLSSTSFPTTIPCHAVFYNCRMFQRGLLNLVIFSPFFASYKTNCTPYSHLEYVLAKLFCLLLDASSSFNVSSRIFSILIPFNRFITCNKNYFSCNLSKINDVLEP